MPDEPPSSSLEASSTAETNRQRISGLIQAGHLSEARDLCTSLCENSPQDADNWFLMGAINGQMGDYPAAEQCCRKAIALQPDSSAAYSNLGSALLLQNRLEEAEAAFTSALNIDPGDAQTHNNLGNLLRNRQMLAEAAECYRKALALNPDFAEASNNLGGVLLMQGDLEAARTHYERALELQPDYLDARINLGKLQFRTGDMQAASDTAEIILANMPQHPDALILLGTVQQQKGELQEALTCFERALQQQPQNAELYFRSGLILNQQGHSQAAAQSFRQATGIKPDFAEAWNGLGAACMHMGKLDTAAQAFQHSISLKPELADAHVNLGRLYTTAGNPDSAVQCCQRALKYDPDNTRAYLCLGGTYKIMARYEEAEECFRKAEQLSPGSVEARAGRANILDAMGKHMKAFDILQPLLDEGIRSTLVANVFANISKDLDKQHEAIAYIEDLLQDQGIGANARRDLYFSLGKLYDNTGEYDAAFAQFSQGRNQVSDGSNPEEDLRLLDNIRAAFSNERMKSLPTSTIETDRPVFIVGMPRSGTSLVEQILASHHAIFGAGELLHMGDIAASIQGITNCSSIYPACIENLTVSQLNELSQGYLDRIAQIAGNESRVTDKMPYNFMHLGLIEMLFPKARVIHCIRDPLDTCLSCYFNYFIGRHAYTRDLATLGRYYRKYEQLMLHWEQCSKLRILEVSYEDLVENQEKTSREMIDFCGLDWDPACLNFHTHERSVLTASYDQVRQPIYNKSVQRWKHYQNHIGELLKALGGSQ